METPGELETDELVQGQWKRGSKTKHQTQETMTKWKMKWLVVKSETLQTGEIHRRKMLEEKKSTEIKSNTKTRQELRTKNTAWK